MSDKGTLTRKQLEEVIASGGSVLVDGQIFATKAELDAHFADVVEAHTAEPGPSGTKEDEILAGNVDQVRAYLQTVTDLEELVRLYGAETDREAPRKGVIAAIEARTAELESE